MRLIMNGINGQYLRNITENYARKTESVEAAVAYATDASLLFDWCWEKNIRLTYYGRLDAGVAVNANILQWFLNKKSPDYVCKLVELHHAKVIWWHGAGLYIGSANLTDNAWNNVNVEAGVFFEEDEIDDEMKSNIDEMFTTLEENSTPLTDEVLSKMKERENILKRNMADAEEFLNSPVFKRWDGLGHVSPKDAKKKKLDKFLDEWRKTLQDLRNIGDLVSLPENRPAWVKDAAPTGALADQFLHAHYYQTIYKKADYDDFFKKNESRKAEALNETVKWWKNLPKAPTDEDVMLNVSAPFLQSALTKESLVAMNEDGFHDICKRIHSITDYARRVRNISVNLPDDVGAYTREQKIEALAKRIWNDGASDGGRVKELLLYILYDGTDEQLPERLWQGVMTPKWKIAGLGISSLGEIVGWALPDRFPPRNGRTSKALRSLGYDVKIH